MSTQYYDPQAGVHLTDKAASKILALLKEEENKKLRFRVFVTGGGCSGFQYGFKLDDSLHEDDTVVKTKKTTVLVDALSLQYLQGAQIDYVEDLQGAKFRVNNPNATTTCGCGISFSL